MGRHALLEALDVPAVNPLSSVPASRTGDPGSQVRTVAEIIAQFRREQGLPGAPAVHTFDDVTGSGSYDLPVDPAVLRLLEPVPAADRDNPDRFAAFETPEQATARTRRESARLSALLPGGETPGSDGQPPHRRRAPRGGGASSVIASLTAELAESHPGLLDAAPHRRRAQARAGQSYGGRSHVSQPARRTSAAGAARTLQPVRVTAGLRGAALRVPALTAGWKVPARTPLVLAGAVAITVVVTDQTGLLPAPTARLDTATATTTTPKRADTAVTNTQAAAASDGARQALSRVSRLERTPIVAATTAGATPASDGTTAITPAPPPDSVMKPGQTIPGDFVRPSPTGVYNSCFCSRWGTFHEGIDFAAPLGSPILAAAAGVVVDAGPASGFGNWVVIRTANGDLNIYGHMRYFYVKAGDTITTGQEIAVVGAEGQSTGPHLHFGVKVGSTNGVDGTYIDPVGWLVARGVDVGTYNQNG